MPETKRKIQEADEEYVPVNMDGTPGKESYTPSRMPPPQEPKEMKEEIVV